MNGIVKPDCFGLLFDGAENDCQVCISGNDCQATMEKNQAEVEAELEAEAKLEAELEATFPAPTPDPVVVVPTPDPVVVPKKTPKAPKAPKEPKEPKPPKAPKEPKEPKVKSDAVIHNRPVFKELMAAGKITPLAVPETGKTYLQVDTGAGIEIYKSQIYHENNLKEFAATGKNPFNPVSLPGEVFTYLQAGGEITFQDAFKFLKTAHPDKKDATLMNRAADVLSGAHFFGIAKITRKEGRKNFFQVQ